MSVAKELERIANLLREETTLSLATVNESGEACVAPLFYIVDEQLSLYWLSSESSLHSVNLRCVPGAAITVYRHAVKWKDIRGVQMRGSVTVITDPKVRRTVVKTYCRRFQLKAIFRLAISRCALYKFTPNFIRSIDNSESFAGKVELERSADNDWKVPITAVEQSMTRG
jgi:uncharacterized protein YhbP (UPF0306 family)